MTSSARVLVAYCTNAGSTAGVARRIANRLGERGFAVDLRPAADAGDPSAYDAVVLGSPVFDGRWMPDADAYVARHAPALAERPVWLFSVGTIADARRVLGRFALREPRNIAQLRSLTGARDYRVFSGVIDRDVWPRASRLLFRALGGRFGDNRDWPVIDAWAGSIADELTGAAAGEARWTPRSTRIA